MAANKLCDNVLLEMYTKEKKKESGSTILVFHRPLDSKIFNLYVLRDILFFSSAKFENR